MGCSVSKFNGEPNATAAAELLSICRERKSLMKSLIGRRLAMAQAHRSFNRSLLSLSTAIRVFINPHCSRPLPPQPPILEKREAEEEESEEEEEDRGVCEHFYDDGAPLIVNSLSGDGGGNFGWDFFNLFDGVRIELENGYHERGSRCCKEREEVRGGANVSRGDSNGGKELLGEGLGEVEQGFVKVATCECSLELSRMLEVSAPGAALHPLVDKFEENPIKSPFQSIAWGRSISSSSSSCKSFFAFSSPCSSTYTEPKDDDFDGYKGMVSGSHSLTLGRLYAWENKLYQETKVAEHMRRTYQQKCLQLKNRDAKCKGTFSPEKTKMEIRDLHSRILVAIRRIDSISQRIEKVRDEELHPQLVELLNGLMRTWKMMSETHKAQKLAISEVKTLLHQKNGEFWNDSHRIATLKLESEVQNWCFCFEEYVSAQRAYAEALNAWLSKFTSQEAKRKRFSLLQSIDDPISFSITHAWLSSIEHLPKKPVVNAMKSFGKDIRALWAHQGEEQQHKRKIDGLAKELDRRISAFQKEEGKVTEENARNRVEYLTQRKSLLDVSRKRLEEEKAKNRDRMEETRRITLHVFQVGFASVFDSLIQFSDASIKMYVDLLPSSENKVQK